LDFERILSSAALQQGRLVRPSDGKPLRKVAWFQCVGSRDIKIEADFCSFVCCMHAIKEALVAKERAEEELEAAIFYMDMRTFGKSFQRYRCQAETQQGVRFERGRVHSLIQDDASGDLIVGHVDYTGTHKEEYFDMVVLSVGQRPAPGTDELAEMVGISLNQWGFCKAEPFSETLTSKEGILLGGSFSGLKDINDSVIQASAAALAASLVIHNTGGSLPLEPISDEPFLDISQEPPRVIVVVCTCGDTLSKLFDPQQLTRRLKTDPCVDQVLFLEQTCTAAGWQNLVELVEKNKPNRILIGACIPYLYSQKTRELGRSVGLVPGLIHVVNLRLMDQLSKLKDETPSADEITVIINELSSILGMGLARLKWADPTPAPRVKIFQQALVVGGGIAGMTAALAIADHGFQVDLVEKEETLGGNLTWLERDLEGNITEIVLEKTRHNLEKHPLIRVHTRSRVVGSYGQVGRFYTTIEDKEKGTFTLEHGVTILATGGMEATTTSYNYGKSEAIITQKELEQKINENILNPNQLESVVMIQCVDSREEPRNYCSRICCDTSLKDALCLKRQNPDIDIYIFYRDIMAYGFVESYYTQARKAGVIFIPYDVAEKPRVTVTDRSIQITALEPIIGQKIRLDADLVVLATGIVPTLPKDLAEAFGVTVDQDGFFQEAEMKWRPVDSIKEGVFACGLAHSPRNIAESIATARAASQRALRILYHEQMPAGKVVAEIHHSLCSLCEQCIEACPYGARTLDLDLEKVIVNPAMCQGCGSCATVCPNSASVLIGFSDRQMLDVIDSAF
jgi:heterodisulfide reductase subunit A